MALWKNGDLADYIQRKPEKSLQLAWIRQMASTIRYVHSKHVIVADIATRNFLVADDLSIKLCDFTESTIMPLDVNMDEADDSGYSVQTDIGQFGAVIYEVVTGKSYSFDLFQGQDDDAMFPRFPSERDLPTTENTWLGPIIRKCWRRGSYQNMDKLCQDLSQVRQPLAARCES